MAEQFVLLIEDNHQNRYLTTFLLEKNDISIVTAEDGKSGIESAREKCPDVILLDIQLPDMDGFEVARALREIPHLANTPIIAVTSHAMPGDRDRILAAGCDDYIEKPIEPDSFIEKVRQYL